MRGDRKALIMDMDGVLADTEVIHVRAWDITLDGAVGPRVREARARMAGMSSPDIAAELIRMFTLPYTVDELVAKKRAVFLRLIEEGLRPFDGVSEELRRWKPRPLALATSSGRADTLRILSRLGFEGWFDPVITCDDVTRAKPAPDCYLLAIQRLGVPAADCVVVEDSLHGIRAARAAGAEVLAVDTSGLPTRVDDVAGVFPSTVEALKWLQS